MKNDINETCKRIIDSPGVREAIVSGDPVRTEAAVKAAISKSNHTLVIAKVDCDGRYGCFVNPPPKTLSDLRDREGNKASVVAQMPLRVAIAAPDLLAACKAALPFIAHFESGWSTHPKADGPGAGELADQLRNAIAKAEGATQ